MNCCHETVIFCCESLTKTADEFIAAMLKTSGITKGGIMKNKQCVRIIEKRKKKEI